MTKYLLKTSPFVTAIVLVVLVAGVSYAATSYRVGKLGVSLAVTEHGTCKVVKNNNGSDIFIPTKTSNEWSLFRTNAKNVTLSNCAMRLLRTDDYRAGTTDKSYSSTAPAGTEEAVIRLWGAAGGPYGNDNMLILSPSIKNVPGGFGGYVSGKVTISPGSKITGVMGAPGVNGRRSGDNNDTWGTHGKKTTAVVGGSEVMVAGGGASVAFSVSKTNGAYSLIAPSPNATAFVDSRRLNYSSGGSPYAGRTQASGVTDATRTAVISKFVPYIGSVGGTGKKNGDYYVWPWYDGYHHLNMTGGTSYINTSVVRSPVYYTGSPANNTSDGGAWNAYFPADSLTTRPAISGQVYAGGGAAVIEYWGY